MYVINSVFAFILLFSYLIPEIKPSILSHLSLLSLFIPIIFIINILFIFYWIIKLKKQFILSLVIILLGYNYLISFINFSNNSEYVGGNNLSVMSYNVNFRLTITPLLSFTLAKYMPELRLGRFRILLCECILLSQISFPSKL